METTIGDYRSRYRQNRAVRYDNLGYDIIYLRNCTGGMETKGSGMLDKGHLTLHPLLKMSNIES